MGFMVAVATPDESLRSPFWLHDAISTMRALDALVEVGVVEALVEGPASARDLADALGLAQRPLELALDVAERTGLVRCSDSGRWTIADPSVARLLAVGAHLPDVLRGKAPADDVSRADESSRLYAGVVERIGRISGELSAAIVPTLRAPGQRVLEVAAGAAPWGRALCADDPTTTVTAVDLPNVIDVTRAAVADAGFDDRFRFVEGDVFTVDGVEPADLVLVAGFCRLLGEDQNRALFPRLAGWCRPGGRVAVVDAVATPAARAAGLAGYELGLLTRTARGRCWSLDHYARWLTDAGFAHIELTPTARPELSIVTAWRNES